MTGNLRKRHIVATVLGLVLGCSGAGAQRRGGASSARMSSAHVTSSFGGHSVSTANSGTAFQTARQVTMIRILPNGRVLSSSMPAANLTSFGSASGVPGLGFDFPHLAAISGGLNNSVGLGRGGRRGQGSFVPILFGGYPYYLDSSDDGQPQQQEQPQPQVIVVQQPGPQPGGDTGNDPAMSLSASSLASAPPERDVSGFILVQRDGRILFASIFSVVGTQLQYVTPEGIRHVVPLSELDADATQQMNEARGTTVQLRN